MRQRSVHQPQLIQATTETESQSFVGGGGGASDPNRTPKRTESFTTGSGGQNPRGYIMNNGGSRRPTQTSNNQIQQNIDCQNQSQINTDCDINEVSPSPNHHHRLQQNQLHQNPHLQHSSISAERCTTRPNRPSSQMTQLQMREGGYVHDIASIVTTVNNNFDLGPSRTLSRENSNEGRCSNEGGQATTHGRGGPLALTQNDFQHQLSHVIASQLQEAADAQKTNGAQSYNPQPKNEESSHFIQNHNSANNFGGFNLLQNQQQPYLTNDPSFQAPDSRSLFKVKNDNFRGDAENCTFDQQGANAVGSSQQRRVIQQVKTLKDRKIQKHILQEYEDEFEQCGTYDETGQLKGEAGSYCIASERQQEQQLQQQYHSYPQAQLAESKRSYQTFQIGGEEHLTVNNSTQLENNYQTFSLNNPVGVEGSALTDEYQSSHKNNETQQQNNINQQQLLVLSHQGANNLAILNSSSYRNNTQTDLEENQSYQKQVTGAFNNQFATTSLDDKQIQLIQGEMDEETSEFKRDIDEITKLEQRRRGRFEESSSQRHKEIDDFINATDENTITEGDNGPNEPLMGEEEAASTIHALDQYHQVSNNQKQQQIQQHFQSLSFDLTKTTPAFKQKLARTGKASNVQQNTNQSSMRSPPSLNTLAMPSNRGGSSGPQLQHHQQQNLQQTRRTIQEQQINKLKSQLVKATQEVDGAGIGKKEINRSRASRAPSSQIYQLKTMQDHQTQQTQHHSHSFSQLKIPTKQNRSTNLIGYQQQQNQQRHQYATSQSQLQNLNKKPHLNQQSTTNSTSIYNPVTVQNQQFQKRNFSTGCEAYTQFSIRQKYDRKVINVLGSGSNKQMINQSLVNTASGSRFEERGQSLPAELQQSSSTTNCDNKNNISKDQHILQNKNFTLVRKSHPGVVSATLLPAQKLRGDDDRELSNHNSNQQQQQQYKTFDKRKKKNLLASRANVMQQQKHSVVNQQQPQHNPYESFPNTVVIGNSSKQSLAVANSNNAMIINSNASGGVGENSCRNDEIDFNTNLQDSENHPAFNSATQLKSSTVDGDSNINDGSIVYYGQGAAGIGSTDKKVIQFSFKHAKAADATNPTSTTSMIANNNQQPQIKRIKKSDINNSSSGQNLSKFSGNNHIKNISQIGSMITKQRTGNKSESQFQQHHADHNNQQQQANHNNAGAVHKTHYSSISGLNNVSACGGGLMNGSQSTILPSPLMKLTNQKTGYQDSSIYTVSSNKMKQQSLNFSSQQMLLQGNTSSSVVEDKSKQQRRSRNKANNHSTLMMQQHSQNITAANCNEEQLQQLQQYRTVETNGTGKPPVFTSSNINTTNSKKQQQQSSKDFKCGKVARKLNNIKNIFWTSDDFKEIPPSKEQTQSMDSIPQIQHQNQQLQLKTANTPSQQAINLMKLRKLAENQKKVVKLPNSQQQNQPVSDVQKKKKSICNNGSSNGFKIFVVDENGVKNRDFSDISHLKFETAKGGKPNNRILIGPSSREEPTILKTANTNTHIAASSSHILLTRDARNGSADNHNDNQSAESGEVKNNNSLGNNTYAHRRRNRYLIAATNQLQQQQQQRQSSSVEHTQSRMGSITNHPHQLISLNQNLQQPQPMRLIKVMDEYSAEAAIRNKSIDDDHHQSYPLVQATNIDNTNNNNRRGRNFSQLPGSNRRRENSIGLQRRSIQKNSIFQQVQLEQLGLVGGDQQRKTGKRANSLVSMLCCYSQKSNKPGAGAGLANHRSSIGNESVGSQESICTIF